MPCGTLSSTTPHLPAPSRGHYLNRNVGIDVQALHRGVEAQQSLIQQATSHGHSRDVRRPVALPDGHMDRALAKSRKYVRLTEELAQLSSGLRRAEKRKELTNARAAIRYKIRQDELKRVREAWDSASAVEDIERQIAGGEVFGPPEEPTATRSARPMSGAQGRMLDTLTAPISETVLGELRRRGDAIKALE